MELTGVLERIIGQISGEIRHEKDCALLLPYGYFWTRVGEICMESPMIDDESLPHGNRQAPPGIQFSVIRRFLLHTHT